MSVKHAPGGPASPRARSQQSRRTSYPNTGTQLNTLPPECPAVHWPAWTDQYRYVPSRELPDFERREGGAR